MRLLSFIILFLSMEINAFTQNWQAVGDFANPNVSDIRVLFNDTIEDKLYIGGNFNHVNNMNAYSIVSYNGNFDTLSNENMQGQIVVEITRFQNKIYIGGFLDCVPGLVHCGVYYFENNQWIPCGGGINGNIQLLFPTDTALIIGGLLNFIVNSDTNHTMVTWNGSTYNPGWDNAINIDGNSLLCAYLWHDTLIIGGNFDLPDGVEEIAYWDGLKWSNLGTGILGNSWINAITEYNGDLYVGGYFTKSAGNAGNFIQRWNGTQWMDVGGGVIGGQIMDMVVFSDELYVVGQFSIAGGVPAKYIAKWDGTNWCGFSDNFDNIIATVDVYHNELFIGGSFKKINNDSIYLLAKWTGGNYIDTCGNTAGIKQNLVIESEFTVYPSPAHNQITIEFDLPAAQDAKIEIRNVLGQVMKTENYSALPPGSNRHVIDIGGIPAGLFFITLKTRNWICNGKFIRE